MDNSPTIVFFPGWSGLPHPSLNFLLSRFESAGYKTLSVPYHFGGTGCIEQTSKSAFNWLGNKMFAHELAPPYVFIGHSMGGLVARYIIQKLGDIVPDASISIATPHNGVGYYDILPDWGPFKAAKQMRAGSAFLGILNSLEWPTGASSGKPLAALNLQAGWDPIVPQKSSTVSWATNQKIPWTEHASVLWSERTFLEIWGFLNYEMS